MPTRPSGLLVDCIGDRGDTESGPRPPGPPDAQTVAILTGWHGEISRWVPLTPTSTGQSAGRPTTWSLPPGLPQPVCGVPRPKSLGQEALQLPLARSAGLVVATRHH